MKIIHKPTGNSVFIGQASMLDAILQSEKWAREDCDFILSDSERKDLVREKVEGVSDTKAREGVIADVSATMVVGLASVIKAISEGKDLAGVKAAIQPLLPMADAVLSTLATAQDLKDPEAAIKAGKIVFPYMIKGGSSKVMGDMASLANGVTSALIAAKKTV